MSTVPESRCGQGAAVRLFVVGHAAALLMMYGFAVAIGGDVTAPLIPPDAALVARADVPQRSGDMLSTRAVAPAVNERLEIAPPWSVDASGRIQLRDR